MKAIALGEAVVRVDAERTRSTYASIDAGGWVKCGCNVCVNFGAMVRNHFPADVLRFFDECGIDPLKDAEVYEFGESRPGFHMYGGEYYFWGEVVRPGDQTLVRDPHFHFTFTPPSPLAQPEFRELGSLCFRFDGELPWKEE